jgi:putative radical SAM enzyme (TIGR03279 family)
MTLFQEIDLTQHSGGLITAIAPGSVAAAVGLQPGDQLLAINDNPVEDVIDVQYYSAEEWLELLVRRDEAYLLFEAERDYNQPLGIEFSHPTFDTDIRRCNNLCEFCFVLQMAPRFRRTLYIKDDDYRYSFLFGHFVTLTNLSEHDWWRIETMGLSPLYISVHVTDTTLRRRFLRNEEAPDIMEQLRWLAARDVAMHTQLVVVPELNDGPWLERSIRELAALWPHVQSISVVPVGLTRHHKYGMRTHTQAEAVATLDYVHALQTEFQQRLGVRFVYPTDEWYLVAGREVLPLAAYDGQQLHENGLGMVRRFLDDWEGVRREIAAWFQEQGPAAPHWPAQLTLATGTLFAPVLREAAGAFAALTGTAVEVVPVMNRRLGDSITVAGLLMAGDIIAALQDSGHGELVVLPRVVFDHPDVISLDDLTPGVVASRLGVPVALADTMGDVWDALLGQSSVVFPPSGTENGARLGPP